jgi:elongation factor P
LISSNDLRPGTKILLEGSLFQVLGYQHHKPGKGGAMVRTKLKNLITGAIVDRTFRPEEKIPLAEIEERKMQYLYRQDEDFYFMDTSNYDQVMLKPSQLADAVHYLKEGDIIAIQFHEEEPVGVVLPIFVELKVIRTDPGVRGDTASGGSKPATLETGMVVQVPLFIDEGEVVRVDTRTATYVERG